MNKKQLFGEDANIDVKLINGKKVKYVNLDGAATTTPFLSVKEKVECELNEYGSVHRGSGYKSNISTEKFEETRETIKGFVNAKPEDYTVFVQNTTSGMNRLAQLFSNIEGKIIVSDIEHSSSCLPWVFHEGRRRNLSQASLKDALLNSTEEMNQNIVKKGREKIITYKTKEDFSFDLDDIEKVFAEQAKKGKDEKIKAFVVTGASNVTGYKPPLKKLSDIAHKYGAMIVVDACQLLQHEKVDMKDQNLDFVVFSGHKMYAPYGAGAIVGNKQLFDAFWPTEMGGGNFPYISSDGEVLRYKNSQAHDPGTPNFTGVRSIHHAIKQMEEIGIEDIAKYEHNLVDKAYKGIKQVDKVKLYASENEQGVFDRILITFNIEGIDSKLVAQILNDEYGTGTRAGSYCVYEYSRRINNIKDDKNIVEDVKNGINASIPGSVRASFSLMNDLEDVNRFVNAVKDIAGKDVDHYLNKYQLDRSTGDWRYNGDKK